MINQTECPERKFTRGALFFFTDSLLYQRKKKSRQTVIEIVVIMQAVVKPWGYVIP